MATGGTAPLSHYKRYTSTRGDGASITWVVAVLIVGAAIAEIVFSDAFLHQVIVAKHARMYRVSYYVARASYILAIVTLVVVTLYIGWVFLDARHPLRESLFYKKNTQASWSNRNSEENRGGYSRYLISRDPAVAGDGAPAPITNLPEWPGAATWSVDRLKRIQANRLFNQRSALTKLMAAESTFFIGFMVLFIIFSTKDSYLQNKSRAESGITETGICIVARNNGTGEICDNLARTAITCAVEAVLFLIAILAALLARPALDPRRNSGNGPAGPTTAGA